jgi:hypothetical protein
LKKPTSRTTQKVSRKNLKKPTSRTTQKASRKRRSRTAIWKKLPKSPTSRCRQCHPDARDAFRNHISKHVSDDVGMGILQTLQPHVVNALGHIYPSICHPHLRVLATRSVGLRNSGIGINSDSLCSSILEILNSDNLPSFKLSNHHLFLHERGGLQLEASDAKLQGDPSPLPPVNVDPHLIYEILARDASLESLYKDGVTVANHILSYLLDDPELKIAIKESFDCYHHHVGFRDAVDRRGWLRNCWYSLFQQAIRLDPVIYALVVAGRKDKEYRLPSNPYYVRLTHKGRLLLLYCLLLNH